MQHTIDSPEALSELASRSDLENASVHIKLLQPLTYKSVFDANRAPETRFAQDSNGNKVGPSKNEYMHLKPLSKSWREPWSRFPTVIGTVTFDMSMECEDGEDRVVWRKRDITVQDGGLEVYIDMRGVTLMLSTLGTVMHMRSRGSVKMDILPPSDDERVDARLRMALSTVREAFEALATGGRSHEEKKAEERRKKELKLGDER